MPKRSPYQDRAIRNYYQNQDTIMLQRLGDLVADLFLAEGKKRTGLWKRAAVALEKLKVPQPQIDHLVKCDNPTLWPASSNNCWIRSNLTRCPPTRPKSIVCDGRSSPSSTTGSSA